MRSLHRRRPRRRALLTVAKVQITTDVLPRLTSIARKITNLSLSKLQSKNPDLADVALRMIFGGSATTRQPWPRSTPPPAHVVGVRAGDRCSGSWGLGRRLRQSQARSCGWRSAMLVLPFEGPKPRLRAATGVGRCLAGSSPGRRGAGLKERGVCGQLRSCRGLGEHGSILQFGGPRAHGDHRHENHSSVISLVARACGP
jgi:hypothetical protein